MQGYHPGAQWQRVQPGDGFRIVGVDHRADIGAPIGGF
jgi:hypothetical protein